MKLSLPSHDYISAIGLNQWPEHIATVDARTTSKLFIIRLVAHTSLYLKATAFCRQQNFCSRVPVFRPEQYFETSDHIFKSVGQKNHFHHSKRLANQHCFLYLPT